MTSGPDHDTPRAVPTSARHWLRTGLLVAASAALLVLAFIGALAYLQTPAGSSRLLRLGLEAANAALLGRVEADEVRITGSRIILHRVTLSDPEGARVAFIDEVQADVVWTALLLGKVEARSIRLLRPTLRVVLDEEGSNLGRTFSERHPDLHHQEPGRQPPPLKFVVHRLELEEGRLDIQTPDGPPLLLQSFYLSGGGHYALRSKAFGLEARGEGRLDQPLPGPVTVSIQAVDDGPQLRAKVDLRSAGASLLADVQSTSLRALEAHLALEVPPALGHALVVGWPLHVPLQMTGDVTGAEQGVLASGSLAAGRARLTLQADIDWEKGVARTLRLEGRHVDFAELLGRGPKSDLGFALRGSGGGRSWAEAVGKMEVEVPATQIRGMDVGPVEFGVRLRAGTFDLGPLHAVLPGVKLSGTGRGSAKSVDASLELEVSELGALTRTLGDVVGPLPPLDGAGSLHLQVSGHLARPTVVGEGHFRTLEVGPASARDLELHLRVPDVRRPLDANANVQASVLVVLGRTLHEMRGSLASEGRSVELLLSTAAAPLRLHLAGTADPDALGLLVDTLRVEFPAEAWDLKAPAAVRFDSAHWEAERLELVSGRQSVAFGGRSTDRTVDGSLEVQALDLAQLPSVLVPASWGLAGTLDLAAELHGHQPHPDVALTAELSGGAWRGLNGLSAGLQARRQGETLALEAHASGLGGSLELSFEGPAQSLVHRIHRPLRLHLRSEGVDVGRTLCQLAQAGLAPTGCWQGAPLVSGLSEVALDVEGFADEPALHLVARGAGFQFRQLPAAEWTLTLEGSETAHLALKLSGKVLNGSLDLEGTLQATTGELLGRRRSWAGWRTLPLRASLEASGLALSALNESRLLSRDVEGTVAVRAELAGSLGELSGQADLSIRHLVVEPWKAADVDFHLSAGKGVEAQLAVAGDAGRMGSAQVSVATGISQLLGASSEELARVAVQLDGSLGPVELKDLPLETNRLRRDRRLLDGQLELKFQGRGTLLAPTGTAVLTATGLGPTDGAHIEGLGHLRYANREHVFDLALHSERAGTLNVKGRLELDLSLPSLRKGIHLAEAPFEATLDSEHFQPDFVAPLVPWMRSISGTAAIAGRASGTLGRPALSGSVLWTDGSMGVIGFGLYQHIQLKASASNEHFSIEELSARVQGGTVSLTLEGMKSTEGFAVTGALRTVDLPIVFDDQLWCIATLKADVAGTARHWQLDLSQVNILQADLQLPEVRRKNLQDLSSPPDVVLTRRGVPIDRRQALRAIALDPRRSGRGSVGRVALGVPFLRLALLAPNRISVRGKDVTLDLGLSKQFQVDLGEVAEVRGEVGILRGRGDVWGRRFEVQPGGRVSFDGPANQPLVSVTGVYTDAQGQVKVYMHFSGQGANIKVTPSSDPPLAESEIYTLLATGRTTLKQSSLGSSSALGASSQAGASIVGSWAANELKKAVGSALPIDVLSVEVNQERGINQTRLEAGKYLTDDIYIGYQARIGADAFRYQNTNSLRVEYQFLRRWSLQLEYGDANAGSLDAVWSRDY
jgi:translocation and assembly module TamB